MSNELIKTINKTDGLTALLELGEALIDTKITNDLLSNIPVVGVIVKLSNLGVGLCDYQFIKKLQKFAFQLDSISIDDRDKYFKEISEDPKKQSKVNDNLFLLINAADDIDKPILIGIVFSAYIVGGISYEQFMQFGVAINGLNAHQFSLLKQQKDNLIPSDVGHTMASFGLVTVVIPAMMGSAIPEYYLNKNGALFLKCIYGIDIDIT
ncbi:hypothetical protein L4D76_19175 [Photobacterium sagamiensis]|uniref:hypothetical protein n=1 Tax=Photobacterium sagamiensis TaxID=2910241 RepID=UPI003D1056C4